MSNYRYNGKKIRYQGKKWRIIDVLSSGSLVIQRWVWKPSHWPFPYRGVVITGLTIDDVEFV